MKLPKTTILAIHLIIALTGLILVLIGVSIEASIGRALLEAVGVGLIASGGVNFFDRLLTQEPTVEGGELVTLARAHADDSIYAQKYKGYKIDVVGVSLNEVMKELVNDPAQRMVDRILNHHVRFRLLLIHPQADFIRQRAYEDKISAETLRERQCKSIELGLLFFRRLKQEYDECKRKGVLDSRLVGAFEIKLIDRCPYFSLFRVDDVIYWGLYTADTTGMNSPMFRVRNSQNPALFDRFKQHFYALYEKDLGGQDNFLVKMEVDAPYLNRKLAEDLLTPEVVAGIMG